MAFTKAPEYNTHQTEIVPVGGPVKTFPLNYEAGADFILQNCVLHKFDDGVGAVPIPPLKPDTVAKGAFDTYYSTGVHNVRSSYAPSLSGYSSPITSVGASFPVVVDNDFWSYVPGQALTLVAANQYTEILGSIGWTDYAVGDTKYIISNEVLSTGTNTNTFRYYDTALNLGSSVSVDLGSQGLPDIVYMDGYLFAVGGLTGQRIYNSTLGTPTTWNTSTDFLDAESMGDPIVGIMRHHNHIVAWGTSTMEFFYNSGNELGSPLQRQANYSQSIGSFFEERSFPVKCAIGDDIYFMGGHKGNYLGIYKLSKFAVEKVSPDWLDTLIAKGSTPTDGVGRYQFPGTLRPFQFGAKYGVIVTAGPNIDFVDEAYFFDPSTGVWSNLTLFEEARRQVSVVSSFGTVFFPHHVTAGNSLSLFANVCTDDFYQNIGEFEDPPGLAMLDSSWKTPALPLKTFNDKHIYSVEVIGNLPYNAITLIVEEDSMRDSFVSRINLGTKTQSKKTFHQNPLIWRNIGRFRTPRFTVQITGSNSYRLGGLVIKYNQGTK